MSPKPKGAGGSAKGATHSSLAVAEWRTLLAEFFASPWSGQQAENFVSAKNRERKAANLKRTKGDQLTLITMQTFKNKASKEKKAAAGEGREPGQFQTLAPVAPEARRIKTTEWAEIEANFVEGDRTVRLDCSASPDAQGRAVVEICAGESKAVGRGALRSRQGRPISLKFWLAAEGSHPKKLYVHDTAR